MIRVERLSKRFGERLALDDVSFEAPAGAVTAFLGPNGAGKTTTMRVILGLDKPTSGTALIGGRMLREYQDPLCQVGALLDIRFAHPRRTAFDHLLVVAATHGIPRSRVHDVIDETGLDSVAARRVGRFSLGMTQRLGIATALLGRPRALIFDEPVNGLDVDGVRWFRQFCRDAAAAGVAVFLSSHLMSEVELVADRVVVLGRGRVIQDASLADLKTGNEVVEVVTNQADVLATALATTPALVELIEAGTLHVTGLSAREVGALALSSGVGLERLCVITRSLEASYRALADDAVEFRAGADGGFAQ